MGTIRFRDFFYIANFLSLLRVILIWPLLYLVQLKTPEATQWLIAVIGFAAVTDVLDGIASRKFNQVTDLGKFLDPLADKLIMCFGMIALAYYRGFPAFLVKLLIYRDLVILAGGMWIMRHQKDPPIANLWGKLNTIVFAAAVLFFLVDALYSVSVFFMGCSFVLLFLSGGSYYLLAEQVLALKSRQKLMMRAGIIALTLVVSFLAY